MNKQGKEEKLYNEIEQNGSILKKSDIIDILNEDGFDINKKIYLEYDLEKLAPKYILMVAIEECSFEVIEILLKYKPDLDPYKKQRYAHPLDKATVFRRPDIINLLIESGSDINLIDNLDCPPMQYAVAKGYNDIIKAFLDKHEDSIINDEILLEIFLDAIGWDRYNITKLFLDRNLVDVNESIEGISALAIAFHSLESKGMEKTVEYINLLVDHGADIHQIDTKDDLKNKTILDLALDLPKEEYNLIIDSLLKGYLDDVKIRAEQNIKKEIKQNSNYVSQIKRKMATKPKISGFKK